MEYRNWQKFTNNGCAVEHPASRFIIFMHVYEILWTV
jgi:hypothetical protein